MELYPGIRAFRRDEANIFFGREALVEQIAERLVRDHFLTISGPSASGKTSLIQAGLLPNLDERSKSSKNPQWRTATMRPGLEPLGRLIEALTPQTVTSAKFFVVDFNSSQIREHLWDLLREVALTDSRDILLVVDQFEEIFRCKWLSSASRREAELFVTALADITTRSESPYLRLILVVRADFIGDCYAFTGLTELVNRGLVIVPPPTREGRLAAIVKPAENAGGVVESEFAARLVDDTDELPDSLVLMQHVLRRMWARENDHGFHVRATDRAFSQPRLTVSGYEAVGGLDHALELHAEEVFSALNDEGRQIATGMFKCLTDKNDGRFFRRPDKLGNIASVVQTSIDDLGRMIRTFQEAGFLITPEEHSEQASDTLIDISHEAVIRQWGRLGEWAETEAESSQMYRRLSQSAQQYRQGMMGVLRGPELTQALDWVSREKPSSQWAARYGGDFELTLSYLRHSEAQRVQDQMSADGRSPAPGGLFICYRRDDSAGDARNISQALAKRFSSRQLFMDVDSISPGSDFEEVLNSALRSCAVVLVLIGPHWLTIADAEGRRRLDNPGDYVRREIREAMSQELRVIPVLLGRVAMPAETELPLDIRRLSKRQSLALKHETYNADLLELLKQLEEFVHPVGLPSRMKLGLTKALQWTRRTPRH